MLSALMTFTPKIFENVFNTDASKASLISGGVLILGGISGTICGGALIRRLRLRARGIIKLYVIHKWRIIQHAGVWCSSRYPCRSSPSSSSAVIAVNLPASPCRIWSIRVTDRRSRRRRSRRRAIATATVGRRCTSRCAMRPRSPCSTRHATLAAPRTWHNAHVCNQRRMPPPE